MPLIIPLFGYDFPPRDPVSNGYSDVEISPIQLLWAAMTVGRANFMDVLAYGRYSEYEMIYRLSMILANLQASGNSLRKSSAFNHLDPAEKGAVSFFLGMTMSKLIAAKKLRVPWLLHLDVYRGELNPVHYPGTRRRPDLAGLSRSGDWVIIESKGRTNGFPQQLLETGKRQTRSIRTIAGRLPRWRVASVTHFAYGNLSVDWADPEDYEEDAIDLDLTPDHLLSLYYRNIYDLLSLNNNNFENDGFRMHRFDNMDFTIGLRSPIYDAYREGNLYQVASEFTKERFPELAMVNGQQFYIGIDGVAIGVSNTLLQLLYNDYI